MSMSNIERMAILEELQAWIGELQVRGRTEQRADVLLLIAALTDEILNSADKLMPVQGMAASQAKQCSHIDYTDTLTGAVCNDCGLEHEVVA
tara:strand:+ start:1776 stop:2051 length:276 start_codon:yes stop_codon:yes gene_type:complete